MKPYFNVQLAYDQESQPSERLEKQLIDYANKHHVPIQQEQKLMNDITEKQQRMPSQLYAVINEIIRVIEKMDEKMDER